jgi:hypothetical protein
MTHHAARPISEYLASAALRLKLGRKNLRGIYLINKNASRVTGEPDKSSETP